MVLAARLQREWRYLTGLARTLARVRSIRPKSTNLLCDDLEAAMDRWRTRPAIAFGGAALNYGELDAMANSFAHWARGQAIERGAVVALFLPNRLEYLPIWYGLSKVGVAVALINNQLAGADLAHCLNISGAGHCLVDAQTQGSFEGARGLLDRPMEAWSLSPPQGVQRDLTVALAGLSEARPDRMLRAGMTAGDTALYIYTSGTTGLPKAARITHMRGQLYMRGFAGATGARPTDRLYLCLPLYHATGGLCAMGAALLNGGSVALRSVFSASRFWDDVAEEKATLFVYVGELWRYLAAQPSHPLERAHRLRLAFGNGLGADVWPTVLDRFGVPRVLEFYGSTEGNVSMFNFDGTPGAIGRWPPYLGSPFNVALARFDVETEVPARGADGFCIKAANGEVGECLGQIHQSVRTAYTGYVDREASERKVLRDAFKKGDRWFRTGDLMRRDKDGCFFFVDRVGDTFRWKGQNVSTTEVAQRLAAGPGVKEATVYGVTVGHLDGRAGMAALVVDADFDLAEFDRYVGHTLPPYAQPVFLRLVSDIATTGTFKHRKMDLVADGFDPDKVASGLYFRVRGEGFTPLTADFHARLAAGEVKL